MMALLGTQTSSPNNRNQLAEERLRISSEYSVTAFCLVILLVFGIGILIHQHLDTILILSGVILCGIYLLQYFLARQFLRPSSRPRNCSDWEMIYTVTASLGGLF
jgi:multisubunit Na+/H+ antiporter MnhB subunit